MLQGGEADGPYFHRTWERVKQTTPLISGGMDALRLPALFEYLGHSRGLHDRLGMARSAVLLALFIVIRAVGNLHGFGSPDDFSYVGCRWSPAS